LACSTFSEGDLPVAGDAGSRGDSADALPPADGAVVDGGVSDASGGPVDAAHDAEFALACGMTTCTMTGAGCCHDPDKTTPDGFLCAKSMDICPPNNVRYTCDDDDDCTVLLGTAGKICCGSLSDHNGGYELYSTACVAPTNCVGPTDIHLCDRTIDGQCAGAKACVALSAFTPPDGGAARNITPAVNACTP
jgi:hypothetical protein